MVSQNSAVRVLVQNELSSEKDEKLFFECRDDVLDRVQVIF